MTHRGTGGGHKETFEKPEAADGIAGILRRHLRGTIVSSFCGDFYSKCNIFYLVYFIRMQKLAAIKCCVCALFHLK